MLCGLENTYCPTLRQRLNLKKRAKQQVQVLLPFELLTWGKTSVGRASMVLITRCMYGQSADVDFLLGVISTPAPSACHVITPTAHPLYLLLTSRQHLVVPGERRSSARPAPWSPWDNTSPGLVWQAAGVLQPHRAQRNKSRQRGRLYSSQKPGEKKEHFLPLHPR